MNKNAMCSWELFKHSLYVRSRPMFIIYILGQKCIAQLPLSFTKCIHLFLFFQFHFIIWISSDYGLSLSQLEQIIIDFVYCREGPSWSWSYGSWIYNYLCNQCLYHWCCVFESRSVRGVQHYMIKFVNDLRQVVGFLRVIRFPSPIKLTATI